MSYWNVHRLLKDDTRRKIIQFVGSRGPVTYTDILRELGISTGKLNYHLRLMSPLLDRGDSEQYYSLNDLGRNAFALLEGFKHEEGPDGSKQLLMRVSWIALTLSLLAIYYSIFGGIRDPDTRIGLGFVSNVLLILAVAASHYSKMALVAGARHVALFSLVALAFGIPIISPVSPLGLQLWSNPFEARTILNVGPSMINSAIFFPTFLAWSLENKGRREWAVSAAIIGAFPTIFAVLFFAIVASSPNGFASLTSTIEYCTSSATGSGCIYGRASIYVSLLPAFLLLTAFSNLASERPVFRNPLSSYFAQRRSAS